MNIIHNITKTGLIIVVVIISNSCIDKNNNCDEDCIGKRFGKDYISICGNRCNGVPIGVWMGESNGKKYSMTFENGKISHIRFIDSFGFNWGVEVLKNKVHGSFRYTYFPSGLAHITGQFERGKKVGKWEYLWFDKSPWIEIDYGTYEKPKQDTLLYEPRPKGLRENYIESLELIYYVDELVYIDFQKKLLDKRKNELEVLLKRNGFEAPTDLKGEEGTRLKEEITLFYRSKYKDYYGLE